jgi:hypothetical protein
MTFAELFTEISSRVWPELRSARLLTLHKSWLRNALIDLQRKVGCLQTAHLHYVELQATYFQCGSSVFEAPEGGVVKEFWTEDVATRCKKIHGKPESRDSYQCLIESASNCACATDVPDPYQKYLVGDYYYDYPELPLGLKYVDDSVDSATRACSRHFALYDGFIWTYPAISSLEIGVLRWEGIKKTWADTDIIPWLDDMGNVDEDVIHACQLYVEVEKAKKEACDVDESRAYRADYDSLVRDMIIDCKRQNRLPDGRSCFTSRSCGSC